MWDKTTQTYEHGIVPSIATNANVISHLLSLNDDGRLRIFGYGSLTWHPGNDDGVLSLSDGRVQKTRGYIHGYQRKWCQRSADHRGTPEFNGIVCTLLSDAEINELQQRQRCYHNHHRGKRKMTSNSMTEGVIYAIDGELTEQCLLELDAREKGGYARDIIDVIEVEDGTVRKALLYRGTPENPAFWERVVFDFLLAAAIMSVAIGPSGPNDVYLHQLNSFLLSHHCGDDDRAFNRPVSVGDACTARLARLVISLQSCYRPYFLFGSGSNEHNQLLLRSHDEHNDEIGNYDDVGMDDDNGFCSNEEGVSEMTELLLVVPRKKSGIESSMNSCDEQPRSLHAGGGHSALLTNGGDLYLWGWNDSGQIGRSDSTMTSNTSSEQDSMKCDKDETVAESLSSGPFSIVFVPPLSIKVESVALGHSHTLVIEKDTGRLFGFGDDGRGQVSGLRGNSKVSPLWYIPRTIKFDLLEEESDGFVAVAAGLFHSAAITRQLGKLITWGCGRFGQCLRSTSAVTDEDGASTIGRWKPPDGSKLIQVACGRRHTVLLDEHGRVWTMGDNKYGQLGHLSSTLSYHQPKLVDGTLGQIDSGCFSIYTGWSHIIALTRDGKGIVSVYGWGRNDKGQLGMNSVNDYIFVPRAIDLLINDDIVVQAACCGAESSHIRGINGNIYSTGWKEHGNLAIGNICGVSDREYSTKWMISSGASVLASPSDVILIAAGGAHLIAT